MASTEIIEKQDTRIPQLDGLRGVAVLMVVLFHYINNGYPLAEQDNLGTFENILVKVTYFGWTGFNGCLCCYTYFGGFVKTLYRTTVD